MGAGIGLRREIDALFYGYQDVLYGFCGTAWCTFADQYRSALVFAVPYGKQLTPETWTEQDFEDGIQMARGRLEDIVKGLEALLKVHRTPYLVPPVEQTDEADLIAPFSFKYAAVQAGIGWIGNSDVIVTERYGPRVRLSAVLIDARFEYGTPLAESRCPDGCLKCAEICPCRALRGVRWDAEKRREELIDYRKCNRMRSAFIPSLSRKSACGPCLAACPFGIN